MKQTFEILPLQGVYWKDKDLKLTFGMSVSEFDALIPDATQTTKYQDTECRMLKMPWGILKTNFLMVQFDENKCLNYIYLDLNTNKVNDLCFVLDGNDISGCKRLLKFLLSENKNILEDNHTETLYFTDAGINLTGIHKSSSCRYLEILPAGYYEDLKDDTHPYPEKQILQKLSKNFTILPRTASSTPSCILAWWRKRSRWIIFSPVCPVCPFTKWRRRFCVSWSFPPIRSFIWTAFPTVRPFLKGANWPSTMRLPLSP